MNRFSFFFLNQLLSVVLHIHCFFFGRQLYIHSSSLSDEVLYRINPTAYFEFEFLFNCNEEVTVMLVLPWHAHNLSTLEGTLLYVTQNSRMLITRISCDYGPHKHGIDSRVVVDKHSSSLDCFHPAL
jgi:hypothetical protein